MLRNAFIQLTLMMSLFHIVFSQTCDNTICSCSGNVCSSCLSQSFYHSSSDNTCYLCSSACKACQSESICSSCSSGFFLDSSSTCQECPLFCQACSSRTQCTTCIDGYAIDEETGECSECALDNVLTCESIMSVQTCMNGFWKNGDSCSPCRQFCYQCTSSNNCLQCTDGYEPVISAGTYCTPCPTGCKACSSSLCTSCFANYRLFNSECISFETECSNIQNCQECDYNSGAVKCQICSYPYYYDAQNQQCKLGSSLMCLNGASGEKAYQCLEGCSETQFSSVSPISGDHYICRPYLWVSKTDIVQYYYESPSVLGKGIFQETESNIFCDMYSGVFSPLFSEKVNTVTISTVFRPYYKLIIHIKAIPVYKSIDSSVYIELNIIMSDNLTNQYVEAMDTASHQSCVPTYYQVQSKYIKDQQVTLNFESTLLSSLSVNSFPNGLMAYSEIMIQLYRCSQQCRICSNSRYCIECYGDLFVYEHKCVDGCYGFFQYYQPNGNIENYTSKSCVQQCPSGFYSTLHPLKTNTYMCSKCISPCETCKGEDECLSCIDPLLYYDLQYNCLDECPNTHYNSSRTCVPCNSPCLTCTDETHCLSCSIGFYYEGQCLGICPDGTYPDYTNSVCQACGVRCEKCINSANICSSCISPYFLLATQCLDECPSETYYESDGKCIQCKAPCLKCLSQTQCLSCLTGYLYESQCLQDCPSGYYQNFADSSCDQCDPKCLTCTSQLICNSCVNGTYLYRSQCLSTCPDRTYPESENNICTSCISPCLTCNAAYFCYSCQIGYISGVIPGTCVKDCEDGYFPNETKITINNSTLTMTSKICSPCAQQCLTCEKETICLSCKNESKVLSLNSCEDECLQQYYESLGVCKLCTYPCLSCFNSSTNCLSCTSPYILFQNSCVSQCGLTYFKTAQKCIECLYPCKRCSSFDICLSCQQNSQGNNQTYLWENACVQECPSGTYADLGTLKCKKCSYPCQQCSSSRVCLTCASGYLNPLKNTCEMCPSTFYANQTSKQCQLCSESLQNCQICSSQTECKYCVDGFYLYQGSCITEIQCNSYSGHYTNEQQMTCSLCVLPCGNCESLSLCMTCLTGFYYNQKCLLSCPSGYYSDSDVKTCQLCNSVICKTCSGTATTCLSCNQTGLYPVLFIANQTCLKSGQCPNEYFIDSSFGYDRCLKCQSPCLTCSSATECLSCLTGILFDSQCRSSCPLSYYAVEVYVNGSLIDQCNQCSSDCLRCRDQEYLCIQCRYGEYLQNYTCVSNCSDGYYLDQNSFECSACRSPCSTCLSNSYCLTCIEGEQILYYGQCIEICPDGTYQTSNQCFKCPEQCQLCKLSENSTNIDQVICKKCSSGLYMNSSAYGSCESGCADNEYPDQNLRQCYECQIPCQTCYSGTQCKSCIDGYMIYDGDCVSGTQCPSGSYKHPTEQRCLNQCPSGYYGDTFIKQCVEQCLYDYVKSPTGICSDSCPSKYHIGGDKLCIKCLNNDCDNLLYMEAAVKSIFNTLYLRIQFSTDVSITEISQSDISIELRELKSTRRRLLTTAVSIPFEVQEKTSQNIWLKLSPETSLPTSQIKVTLSSYYIFPGQTIQNINSTAILTSFDYYSSEEISKGEAFQTYAQVISIIFFIVLIINIVLNNGYLLYSTIDYFQILFFLLFLDIDYPPILNQFLYGFRYSHYLFLPQIFQTEQITNLNIQEAPTQFGIIMSDVSFLNNTGHDFLILFIAFGVLALFKIIDLIISCKLKSNRIQNQSENNTSNENQDRTIQSSNLSEQIQKNEHGRLPKYIKMIVNRIKWNYFNDIVFMIYLYVMIFGFTQTYDMSAENDIHYASNIFAILFLIFGFSWPIFLTIMLCLKKDKIEENKEVLPEFKCFYGNVKHNSKLGLFMVPMRFVKKLILSVLFVYCSRYENFILGVIIMTSILIITLTLIYRQYNNKIQLVFNCIFEGIFGCACLGISVIVVSQMQFTIQQKMQAAQGVAIIFLILSLLLLIFNIVRLVLEGMKFFCDKDVLAQFKEQQQESTSSKTMNIQDGESNIRLNVKMRHQETEKDETSEDSGFGIYLKKSKQPPPLLIKCVKGSQLNSSNEQDDSDVESEKKNNSKDKENAVEEQQSVEEPIIKVIKGKQGEEAPQKIIFPQLLQIQENEFEADEEASRKE